MVPEEPAQSPALIAHVRGAPSQHVLHASSMTRIVRPALAQALLSRRIVAYAAWERLYYELCMSPALVDDTEALHAELAPLGLEVRTCHDEDSGAPFVVLVNAKADELAELATPYTPSELQYIKALIAAIVQAPRRRFAVSSMHALQLATRMEPTPMTRLAASEVLKSLERRDWLRWSRTDGTYALTLRALSELDTYLRHEFEDDVLSCPQCLALVTRGVQCATPACRAAVHTSCEGAYRARHAVCVVCGQPWEPQPLGT